MNEQATLLMPLGDVSLGEAIQWVGAFLAGFKSTQTRRAYRRDPECWFAFCTAHQLHPFRNVRRPIWRCTCATSRFMIRPRRRARPRACPRSRHRCAGGRRSRRGGEQRIGVGDRQPGRSEAVIEQPGGTEGSHHRVVERRPVLGVHGVHGVMRINVALTTARSANAASRSAGSKSATRFHRARYGDAASCVCSATMRPTASAVSRDSRCSSSCRSSVARLSCRR